ncbi:MAG: DUF885 domain-containing protein [Alphaproteobacteria bacterium]
MLGPISRRTTVALLGATALTPLLSARAAEGGAVDARFASATKRWLDGALKLSPISATQIGDHRFDGEIDDISEGGRKTAIGWSRTYLRELESIDRAQLSRANQVDAAVLTNELRYDIWDDEVLQSWAWNPLSYNDSAGAAIYLLVARDFAPLPDRLRSATSRMEKLPRFYEQARTNLDAKHVPEVHAQTVAKQNKGVISLVDGLLAPHAGELPRAQQARFKKAIDTAKAAVNRHQEYLDKSLLPNAKGDFRLGEKLYDQKLAFALNSPLTRQEIKSRAEEAVKRIRSEMYEIAKKALKGRKGAPKAPRNPTPEQQQNVIEAALELAYAQRPTRDQVVPTAEKALEHATAFVREKDLITLPDAPLKIIIMPEFQRGVAVAYCDPPGPLEKGLSTMYAVSPIPDDWTPEQAESFLREYNTLGIHEVTIHEAVPGHYVQLWHANRYPSILRSVLYSGPFVEGWACYSQDVMAEAGYLDRDPLYLLVHLKLNLRAVVNALLDVGVHVEGMSREDAMKLMTVTAFQQEREAAGKWIRASVTSAQLPTYFVGQEEHTALRKEAEQRWGASFNLKHYHDTVLSFGSPPVRYARALMLDEAIG